MTTVHIYCTDTRSSTDCRCTNTLQREVHLGPAELLLVPGCKGFGWRGFPFALSSVLIVGGRQWLMCVHTHCTCMRAPSRAPHALVPMLYCFCSALLDNNDYARAKANAPRSYALTCRYVMMSAALAQTASRIVKGITMRVSFPSIRAMISLLSVCGACGCGCCCGGGGGACGVM
jgi:hypothetical protein